VWRQDALDSRHRNSTGFGVDGLWTQLSNYVPQGDYQAHAQRATDEDGACERTQSSHRAKQAIAQLEPWLLASSCSLSYLSAEAVVSVYARRMQIEEAFRDTKNVRMGLGLSASGSRGGKRLAVLALIACLAEFVLRLIGQTAIGKSLQYELQLSNRRSRPELSCLQVGRLLLQKTLATFTKAEFDNTLKRWRMPHHALQI
jgi:hypothetical protein